MNQVQSLSKSHDLSSSNDLSIKSGNQDSSSKGLFSFGITSNRKKPLESLASFDLDCEQESQIESRIDELPEDSINENESKEQRPKSYTQRMLLPNLPLVEIKKES